MVVGADVLSPSRRLADFLRRSRRLRLEGEASLLRNTEKSGASRSRVLSLSKGIGPKKGGHGDPPLQNYDKN